MLSVNIFAETSATKLNKLVNSKYWQTLLHVKDGESQIDSPGFFLAKNGKFDSLEELNASINNLTNPKFSGDNFTYCRYPVRRTWIKNLENLVIKNKIILSSDLIKNMAT